MGTCPKCETPVLHANIEVITLSDAEMSPWRGLSYSCPTCHCVLSVGFDPVALESDVVKAVVEALRKG